MLSQFLGADEELMHAKVGVKKHRKLLIRTQRRCRIIRDAPTLVCSSMPRERRISARSPTAASGALRPEAFADSPLGFAPFPRSPPRELRSSLT